MNDRLRSTASCAMVLVLALFSCGRPGEEQAVVSKDDPQEEGTAPIAEAEPRARAKDVLSLPQEYGATWHVPVLAQFDPEEVAHHSDSTGDVTHRRADLDGDGRMDAAYFLRSGSERKDSTYAVVVVFGDGRDTLLGIFSWAEARGYIGAGLELYPPSTLHHFGSAEADIGSPVILAHPALSLMYFGSSEVTWFWRAGSFHRIWTAD